MYKSQNSRMKQYKLTILTTLNSYDPIFHNI